MSYLPGAVLNGLVASVNYTLFVSLDNPMHLGFAVAWSFITLYFIAKEVSRP